MSEYQYHEWQTVDKLLSPSEQAAVEGLSSHIEVSSSKAVVTYNWSDFKHDPYQVLLKYFDAYFYMANWGSLRLMFRFPKGTLEEKEITPYRLGECIGFTIKGAYQVLDLDFNPEDGGWFEEVDADLSDFISLRADLIQGDYRLLYLAWLKDMTLNGEPKLDETDGEDEPDQSPDEEDETFDEEDEDETGVTLDSENEDSWHTLEPPVPPGLKHLTPALQNFVRAFGLDPFLVRAAAEASPEPGAAPALEYRQWIAQLTRSECEDFLTRLAEGDTAVGMDLRKRLKEFAPPQDLPRQAAGTRTLMDLTRRAGQLKVADKQRRAEEARLKHIAEMKELAKREPQAWQEVDRLLETGSMSAAVYDEATQKLERLKQLSEYQDTHAAFRSQIRRLADKFASRPSLMKRWKERGWI